MSGRHKFSELTKHFTPARRQEIAARTAEMLAAIEAAQTPEPPQPPARPDAPAEETAGR